MFEGKAVNFPAHLQGRIVHSVPNKVGTGLVGGLGRTSLQGLVNFEKWMDIF